MIHFSRKILDRVLLLAAGLVTTFGVTIFLIVQGRFDYRGEDAWGETAVWLQLILFVSIIGVLIYFITKNVRALRDPDRLNKLHIAETDERNIFIQQKTGSIGINIVIFGLAIGTIVTGSYNPQAFFAFLISLLFVIAVRVFLTVYYRNMY